jgi:hypothetical protein
MDGHKHEELSDEMLEREIEAALGVDPLPQFLPRVRARIGNEDMEEGWFSSASWRWTGAVAVVTAVAIIGVWMVRDPAPGSREAPTTNTLPVETTTPSTESAHPASALAASSTEAPKPVSAPLVRTVRSTRSPAVVARPEVLISLDEAVALRQLIVAIAARQVEASDIPQLAAESAPLPTIEEIVLEPIKLSPLDGLESE